MSFAARLITRAQWEAQPARPGIPALDPAAVRGAAAHWEAAAPEADHADCYQQLRNIQAAHMANTAEGYRDIAYNHCYCDHGFIFEGRGWEFIDGADGDYADNVSYPAVCWLGGPGYSPSRDAIDALVDWLLEHQTRFPDGGLLYPHRVFVATQCPGDELAELIGASHFQRDDFIVMHLTEPAPTPAPTPTPEPSEEDDVAIEFPPAVEQSFSELGDEGEYAECFINVSNPFGTTPAGCHLERRASDGTPIGPSIDFTVDPLKAVGVKLFAELGGPVKKSQLPSTVRLTATAPVGLSRTLVK